MQKIPIRKDFSKFNLTGVKIYLYRFSDIPILKRWANSDLKIHGGN